MSATLNERQLFDLLLDSITASGWQAIAVERRKPFLFRVFKAEDSRFFNLRVYIWNCTHGGGAARAKDEYRIQLTSVVPQVKPGELTLLLGWHSGYGVFVAFDISKHAGQASASPSIQVKEATLSAAHSKAFSAYDRANGEIAVAFRPEFLIDYALDSQRLHGAASDPKALAALESLDTTPEEDIDKIKNVERRSVISTIKRKYREHDFRNRVLTAYSHRCAMCGVQLQLVEAAHILPVAAEKSTDDTSNGIALCKLHHAAFDRNLVSFDESYRVELSNAEEARLAAENLAGGFKDFKKQIKTAILLPADKRDYPSPFFIKEGRRIRSWAG